MERNWLINDGTGSVGGGTGWHLVVLGQYRSVLIDTWLDWLIYDCTGPVEGGTGQYLVVLGQKKAILVDT